MYYKITNTESKVYKDLHKLRAHELKIDAENKKAVIKKVELKWQKYLGCAGQQNLWRVTRYDGFLFEEPEKVDLKIWQPHSDHKDTYVPNRKTKAGREMYEFLHNGLKNSFYQKVFDILKVEHGNRFRFPYVHVAKNAIVIFLDGCDEPKNKDVIEITGKEFRKLNR